MRVRFLLGALLLFVTALAAQDRHNWGSLAQLKPGDQVRVSLAARGPLIGEFRTWTPEQISVANVSASKQQVLKVERYRQDGLSRGKRAALGAMIGFGGGFAIGAAIGGNCANQVGACVSRGELGGIIGAVGGLGGALLGAALPVHRRELIYSSR